MRYYGGKARTGKEIAEIILKYAPPEKYKGYIEPFCGALGVTRHLAGSYNKCYASDACEDIILLWKKVQKGSFALPEMSKEIWLKYKIAEPSAERAFAGFGCSFGGVWFSGYAKEYGGDSKREPEKEAYKAVNEIKETIKNVKFKNQGYEKWETKLKEGGYVVYCDPPYKNTQFKFGTKIFNFDMFWSIMKRWKNYGNIVFVSEKNAPRGIKCVYKRKLQKSITCNSKHTTYIDKLFML